MKFYIETLGCKVNAYESSFLNEKLTLEGYIKSNAKDANIIIVNTCSVTHNADQKCLKEVRKLKRLNKDAFFVVLGCSVQNNLSLYEELNLNVILGNNEKSKVIDLIKRKENYTHLEKMYRLEFEDMQITKFDHIRAYLKIQDGCNNYCSYCIIPYLRGNLRCKDYNLVLEEAKCLAQNNYHEIILTGIHTGSYQSDNHDLFDLINDLSKINGLNRIRLSSIEITELNDKFMDLLKNNQILCDNLHIPLQGGSDKILKIMNRKYNLEYYEEKIKKIRSIRPDIYISTDILVGHPFEEDEDFNSTLAFCQKIKFSKIHVFPYSKREGTPSAKMKEVSALDKKVRTKKLIELSNKLEEAYFEKYFGKKLEVLIEEEKEGYKVGHTNNFLKIRLKGDYQINSFYEITLTEDMNATFW